MTKKRDQDQSETDKPVMSRRELLIRTGQVALVVGSADVFATIVSACGGGGGDGTGPHGGKQTCYKFTDYYDKQWADYYGYTGYCYESYTYNGEQYGTYNVQGGRKLALSEPPRYQRGE